MPLITDTLPQRAAPYLTPPDVRPTRTPSWGDTFSSAFRLENDVVNALELMRKPIFPRNPMFDLGKRLKEEDLWDFERDDFISAQSEEEFQYLLQKRNRDKRDKDTLARAGWGGIAAAISAGVISPTLFIPLIGPGARAGHVGQAMLEGAGLMAVASGVQEGILLANQPTRGGAESAVGITAGVVLGGILGGAAGLLRRGDFERMAYDMVNPRGEPSISSLPTANSAGAAAVEHTDVGGLKRGPANFLSGIGPVTRGIQQQTSPLVRWMTSQFSDAGVRREGHAAGLIAAEGGTIENNIKTYFAHIQRLNEETKRLYNDYIFDGAPPRVGATPRAFFAGLNTPGKMSKLQFREAVTRALWSGDQHPVKQVQELAQAIRRDIYDPIFKEAQEVGLYSDVAELEKVIGDASYGMRMYNTDYISAHFNRFVDKLAEHVKRKLETDFQARLERLADQTRKDEELVEDLTRPAEDVAELRARFQAQLDELDETRSDEIADLEEEIDRIKEERERHREVRKAGVSTQGMFEPLPATHPAAPDPRPFRDRLVALREKGGKEFAELLVQRKELRRRLRNLNKSLVAMTERHQKKLAKIERNEELQLRTLNRAVRSGQRFLREIASLTDKEWAKRTGEVRERFENAASSLEKAEMQRSKIMQSDTDPDGDRLWAQDAVVDKRNQKVIDLFNKLDELDSFDRPAWQKAIQMGLDEALERYRDINARRAVRAQKMADAAKQLDPKVFGKKLDDIKGRIKERQLKFADEWRSKAADTTDLAKGTADFKAYSQKTAEEIANKILGTERRIAFHDIIQAERGPELARMLDFSSNDFAEFLHTDVEQVVRTYIRTLAADISIARKFGRADAAEYFKKLTEEKDNAVRALENAKDKKGEPLSDEKKAKLSQQLNNFYTDARKDLYVLIERAKGIRGVPKDPRGWAARAASVALNLNVLRYMGGVLLASVADPARVIQKYGLMRTMKQATLAFTGGLKELRMSQREAQLAGTALDVALHTRAHAMYDIFDDFRHGTKVEKGLEWATQKMGVVALFDYWNAGMKQIAAGIENAVILEAISKAVAGKASKKELEELAARNIDADTAAIIWEQVTGKGGAQVNGVWLPETEAWDITRPEVAKALRTYRSALVGTVDDTIVTPGMERPNWIDSGIAGRLLGQFRSFGLSSTTKTLMSGMQQRDMAYFTGMSISLAMGALSYYLWAVSTGGQAYEDMMKAPLSKWFDEMIARSGQTAVFDEVMRVAQRIPAVNQYASFSGTRATRREGGDLTESILGPTFDAFEKLNTVIMGADDPTQHTLHTLRQLLPFQNLLLIRQLWDMLEAEVDLPEKRDNK